jgi:quercetin dioxygenase-like cupin family protein
MQRVSIQRRPGWCGRGPAAGAPAPPLPSLQSLISAEAGATSLTVLINEVQPDETVPLHTHEVEEVLVVVDGSCEVTAGRTTLHAERGDAVIVPAGVRHGISHAGTGAARVVAVLASAIPPTAAAQLYRPDAAAQG